MKTFIANTGLHSAGRCLESKALGLVDVKGLLQLGTELVFSEEILVSGFEYDTIKQRSRLIRHKLRRIGVPSDTLQIRSFRAYRYAKACRDAAITFASEFEYVFPPAVHLSPVLQAARPDMLPEEFKFIKQLHGLILEDCTGDDIKRAADPALVGRARSSIAYMLATCPMLLQKVRDFAHSEGWSEETTWELVAALRYYANQKLGSIKGSMYTPAVARAELVRSCSDLLSERLSTIVTEAACRLQPRSLRIPGVAGALLIRSKGDPKAVVEEALSLRDKACELRNYLTEKLHDFEPEYSGWHHELNVQISELARALDEELHPERRPHWTNAIQLHVGPPFLSLQIAELSKWREFMKLRKRITVLTEVSMILAYDNTERAVLQQLLKNCVKEH